MYIQRVAVWLPRDVVVVAVVVQALLNPRGIIIKVGQKTLTIESSPKTNGRQYRFEFRAFFHGLV